MDIVENLVHSIYVLGEVAVEIKQSTPPRPAKKKAPHKGGIQNA
jgi:hypothetical protein